MAKRRAEPKAPQPAPEPSVFSRITQVERLSPARAPITLSEAASDEEREAIKSSLELAALEAFSYRFELRPWRRGWRLNGAISADLAQHCVVTLEPAPAKITDEVARFWLPEQYHEAGPATLDLEAEEEDAPEILPHQIDLGAIALEALTLALPLYPRAPGAEFEAARSAPPGVEDLKDEDIKPFAKLAALRDKLANNDQDDGNS